MHNNGAVYFTPKLWYVKVNLVEAENLVPTEDCRFSKVYAKAKIGSHKRIVSAKSGSNPVWNEELVFVAAEPFEDPLVFTVIDRVANDRKITVGKSTVSLHHVNYRRINHECRWYQLENVNRNIDGAGNVNHLRTYDRIRARVGLEGGYQSYNLGMEKALRNMNVGVLELGIVGANGLSAMKSREGKDVTDAFCVAKYEQEWIRTGTVYDSFAPRWNKSCKWEVYDPCTVLTVAVFDDRRMQDVNCASGCDNKMGKVRICLSTLETGRLYSYMYPLFVLFPSGLKRMGQIELAVRLTCTSPLKMMHTYTEPLMCPKMSNYLYPLPAGHHERLRREAAQIVSMHLSRSEPPLGKEITDYFFDLDSNTWSMRKAKESIDRIMKIYRFLSELKELYDDLSEWVNAFYTIVFYIVWMLCLLRPSAIFLTILTWLLIYKQELFLLWSTTRQPLQMDTLSLDHAITADFDDLDEEFDTIPASRSPDTVRMRYDRLRVVASSLQNTADYVAAQCERIESLLSFRDLRASNLFVTFCIFLGVLIWFLPIKLLLLVVGYYLMLPRRFQQRISCVPLNFFSRQPTRVDTSIFR